MGRKNKVKFDSRFESLEKDPVFVRKRKATLACFVIRMFLLVLNMQLFYLQFGCI